MADDLLGGWKNNLTAGAKAMTGAAGWLGSKLGIGGGAPAAPMPGRLPLGEVPKTMPVVKTPTGGLMKKGF